jgi:hypothetical protein
MTYKFLFEIGDCLIQEKWIAEQHVKNPRTDILRIHPQFMYENNIKLDKEFIPLGTVKFCSKYMANHGIHAAPVDYPYQLKKYLKRRVEIGCFSDARSDQYIKPLHTKEFTCGLKDKVDTDIDLSEKYIWISDPIKITQEYRCYVLNNRLEGDSRYDDLESEDILPNFTTVFDMIASYEDAAPASYTLDVALMEETGETVLIEVNDMWATGLYPWGTMTGEKYLECLQVRWFEMIDIDNY